MKVAVYLCHRFFLTALCLFLFTLSLFHFSLPRAAFAESFLSCQQNEVNHRAVNHIHPAYCSTAPQLNWHSCADALLDDFNSKLQARHEFATAAPEIRIINSTQPNAFAMRPNDIVISTALLDKIATYDELAFVIAHELGHISLRHLDLSPLQTLASTVSGVELSGLRHEFEADRFAMDLLRSAGFDSGHSYGVIKRISETLGQTGEAQDLCTASGLSARVEALVTRP